MKEIIQTLKDQLAQLEKEYALQVEMGYRKGPHKSFSVGDWITDGENIGIVGWTTNKAVGIEENDGYMGVDLKNGSQGFMAPVKRDEWRLLDDSLKTFFTEPIDINITFTGADMVRAIKEIYQNHGSPLIALRADLVNIIRREEARTGHKIIL